MGCFDTDVGPANNQQSSLYNQILHIQKLYFHVLPYISGGVCTYKSSLYVGRSLQP